MVIAFYGQFASHFVKKCLPYFVYAPYLSKPSPLAIFLQRNAVQKIGTIYDAPNFVFAKISVFPENVGDQGGGGRSRRCRMPRGGEYKLSYQGVPFNLAF